MIGKKERTIILQLAVDRGVIFRMCVKERVLTLTSKEIDTYRKGADLHPYPTVGKFSF